MGRIRVNSYCNLIEILSSRGHSKRLSVDQVLIRLTG